VSKAPNAGLNPADHPSPWNLPNAITAARILLVPLFIWLELKYPVSSLAGWWGVLVFVLASATDGIDGAIARRRGLITNLGKILDPIADKALTGAGFILLSWFGLVPWWATILVLIREWGITVFRLVVVNRVVIAASAGGKLKTILQSVIIPLMLAPVSFTWLAVPEAILLWLTVALTVLTGYQYVHQAIKANHV
jgi:CDP-diacylglycerol---glycerol-3-phosphate 3-phosphatidyltransferase